METKLKPCPFCGSTQIKHVSRHNVRYLRCVLCSCTGGHVFRHENTVEFDNAAVVSRWNTRKLEKKAEVAQ